MDTVSLDSSNRLLEAFERMSVPQGEGLVSSGPSPVPDALSRAFENLLEQNGVQAAPEGLVEQTNVPQAVPSSTDAATGEGLRPENVKEAPSSAPSASGEALLSPSELYRLQFQVAMLRFQADAGQQVTQKTTQSLDSLLRNQS